MSDGLVIVDKPAGLTSHDVVSRVRRMARTRRVGHAGTLDPMATGVLVLGVDKATRLLHHLVLTDKAYTATIRIGESTITDDAEGDLILARSTASVVDTDIDSAVTQLTGDLMQVPSSVSAIKVDGQRSYKRVRDGEAVALSPRAVTVSRFDVLAITRPGEHVVDVEVSVECSSGTYVRALARDLGEALGVGGHLTALRRTRVGPFALASAGTLDELTLLDDPVTLPLAAAVRAAMPTRLLEPQEVRELSYGRWIEGRGTLGTHGALDAGGSVIALLSEDGGRARPILVFAPAG
ncbi:MAG: tRNA pseudouridine(55) synthase TruB [Actinomycetota bacterium]|nr:tRNA pseudouridine(55) synthase TruB [Actinomycetota bacterium]